MIAKKDQAAYVYYLYAPVVKIELPNSSEGQNCAGNEYRNWFFGCQVCLVSCHIFFSIIHSVIWCYVFSAW